MDLDRLSQHLIERYQHGMPLCAEPYREMAQVLKCSEAELMTCLQRLELAGALFEAVGVEPTIEFIEMPESIRDRYQYFTEARMDRIRALGFPGQSTPLEEGVRRYVQDFLSQPDPYR